MKEIVLDTETTGLSVKEGHRIVEIGCIELDNLIPTKKQFHCYLNPERKVSEKAFEVHGYSDSFLSDKMKFREIADDFLRFIKDKRLIIHNAEFDLSHLNNELQIIGKNKIDNEVIDTVSLARDFKNKEEEVSKLNTGKVIYSTRVIKPTPEELKNHQIYLKTSLKKNFY